MPQALKFAICTDASMEVKQREMCEQSCSGILGWVVHRSNSWIVHGTTRCRYNKWLTIGSGFNKHCQLESRRLGNQPVQSFTRVPFGGFMGSFAWPILCHLESTVSTCVTKREGSTIIVMLLMFISYLIYWYLAVCWAWAQVKQPWHHEKHLIAIGLNLEKTSHQS